MKFLVALFLFTLPARADVTVVHVFVKGMVCAFCANGLKHVLEKEDAVANVVIHLDDHELRLFIKDGHQMTERQISDAVKKAGFEVSRILN